MWGSRSYAKMAVQQSLHADAQRRQQQDEANRIVVRDALGMDAMLGLSQDEVNRVANLIGAGTEAAEAYVQVTGKMAA